MNSRHLPFVFILLLACIAQVGADPVIRCDIHDPNFIAALQLHAKLLTTRGHGLTKANIEPKAWSKILQPCVALMSYADSKVRISGIDYACQFIDEFISKSAPQKVCDELKSAFMNARADRHTRADIEQIERCFRILAIKCRVPDFDTRHVITQPFDTFNPLRLTASSTSEDSEAEPATHDGRTSDTTESGDPSSGTLGTLDMSLCGNSSDGGTPPGTGSLSSFFSPADDEAAADDEEADNATRPQDAELAVFN